MLRYTQYFLTIRMRPDRARISLAWIEEVVHNPIDESIQHDGRIRRWGYIPEVNRYLRVVLLDDGETVHNAFFDRNFKG